MTRSPVLLLLAGLQLVGAIGLAAACYFQVRYVRQLNERNAVLVRFAENRQYVTSLVNDCVEYGKKNPAIDPILASAGVKISRSQPATTPAAPSNKPAAKPGGR